MNEEELKEEFKKLKISVEYIEIIIETIKKGMGVGSFRTAEDVVKGLEELKEKTEVLLKAYEIIEEVEENKKNG